MFVIPDTQHTHDTILQTTKNLYRYYRSRLHDHFKKFTTKEESLHKKPDEVDKDEWKFLVEYFNSKASKKTSERNKINKGKQEINPVCGRKFFQSLSFVARDQNSGKESTFQKLWEMTHVKSNGQWVNDASTELNVLAILKELVHKALSETTELKQYPSLRAEVSNAAVESLERMRDESKKATLQLVEMECSYLTVDFFRRLPQDIEKGGNPTHSIFDRYNDSYLRRIGSNVLSYVNMVCASLRNSIPKEDLSDMMEKGSKERLGWGNCFGCVLLPFKIALCDDPLDYVKEAKAAIDRKNSFEAFYTLFMAELLSKILGSKFVSAITLRVLSNTTICFTNLLGPQEEIEFCGHPLAYFAPTTYGQPNALTINFQSYINKMTIVLGVDESAIPDPQQLLDDFEDSMKLIKDAVIARGLLKN